MSHGSPFGNYIFTLIQFRKDSGVLDALYFFFSFYSGFVVDSNKRFFQPRCRDLLPFGFKNIKEKKRQSVAMLGKGDFSLRLMVLN